MNFANIAASFATHAVVIDAIGRAAMAMTGSLADRLVDPGHKNHLALRLVNAAALLSQVRLNLLDVQDILDTLPSDRRVEFWQTCFSTLLEQEFTDTKPSDDLDMDELMKLAGEIAKNFGVTVVRCQPKGKH